MKITTYFLRQKDPRIFIKIFILLGQQYKLNIIKFIFIWTIFYDSLKNTLGITALSSFLVFINKEAWDLDVGLELLFGVAVKIVGLFIH